MLAVTSCLPPLAHILGQVQAWHCPVAGPSFTLPGPQILRLDLYLLIQPRAVVGARAQPRVT